MKGGKVIWGYMIFIHKDQHSIKKIYRHAVSHLNENLKKKHSIEIEPQVTEILESVDKDFKITDKYI